MPFSPKEAAENLIKLANELEVQAMDVSYLVCDKCHHTANLTTINDKRRKVASEMNVKNVNTVTVNDKLSCPACEGTMSYAPTEASQRYYVEAAEGGPLDVAPPTDMPIDEMPPVDEGEEKGKKPALKELAPAPDESEPAPMDNGDIFSPVDERDKDKGKGLDLGFGDEDVEEKKPEATPPAEGAPTDMPPTDEMPTELPSVDKKPDDSAPGMGDSAPTDDTVKSPEEGEPPVVEETVPGELEAPEGFEVPKKPKKKKEEVEFPKKDVPKFEKMPTKDASDALYQASLRKYLF
jgi:hypothetical protein